jgi:hypothetical protein
MRIVGEWFPYEDGTVLPTLWGNVLGADGSLHAERFLVDTGADRTVFSAVLARALKLPARLPPAGESLAGVGGTSNSALVTSLIEFQRDEGGTARVRGEYATFTGPHVVDLSILGRDVLNNFDVIVSRQRGEVLLIAGRHRYQVVQE